MNYDSSNPSVVEDYGDYSPSFKVLFIIKTLLEYVPSKYTNGLEKIVLKNSAGLNRKHRRQKTLSRKRRVALKESLGLYYQQSKGNPAHIVLFVDNIEKNAPALALKLPILREIIVGGILHHEIGHHIHKTIHPEHREREDIAEEWSIKLGRQYIRRKYWYLTPLFYLLSRSIKEWKKIRRMLGKEKNQQN